MSRTLRGWRGQQIVGAASRGSGVFAARDWREITLDHVGDIERKAAVGSSKISDFDEADRPMLKEVSGRYSSVQSINCEDTATWAAFHPRLVTDIAISRLLDQAFGATPRPATWSRRFWTRWPHPETGSVANGPEPDLVLTAPGGWCYVVEAKWRATLDAEQGQTGDTSQLAMRKLIAERESRVTGRRGVLVILPSPKRYPHAREHHFASHFAVEGEGYLPLAAADALGCRILTWEQVISTLAVEDPNAEVLLYLRWRLGFLDDTDDVGLLAAVR